MGKGYGCAFQFHTGSIKSETGDDVTFMYDVFQFHTGSIKRPKGYMVSFEHVQFQFHTGSIKRERDGCLLHFL